MEKYVHQLIQDIKAAHRQSDLCDDTFPEDYLDEDASFLNHIDDVENFVAGIEDTTPPFSYYCGLEAIQFPPVLKLTEGQMIRICHHFTRLLKSYNLHYSLPEGLPIKLKYETLLTILNYRTTLPNIGFITIEFCDYEPLGCAFDSYCDCQKYILDDEDMDYDYDEDYSVPPDLDGDDLPF